ncbi:MAG: alpha-amylase family glycosyl hydrolase [Chloroflexota bacterium]
MGIDAIWISPFYPSPMADFGYDVANYTDVDKMFGDLATFDRLVQEAHKRNIKLIVDYVPNHSSDEHAWFTESSSSRDNPKADWYIWKDPKPDGSLPNNWGAVFGGPAWTWNEARQQYYFHQFHPKQPDLNWRNPEVREAMHNVLRFWMDRGVDGFRMDVVYMIWKHPDMPDQPPMSRNLALRGDDDIFNTQEQIYSFNYDGIHERMKELRAVLNEQEAVGIGEIWLPLKERMKFYGQDDEFHMPFNFGLFASKDGDFSSDAEWSAERVREVVDEYEQAANPVSGWPNWVLGNHDIPRLASRVGEKHARLAAMLLLSLRGTPTLYMGDEIGMVNGEIAPEQMRDPQGVNLGVEHTRDVCRTPMQWDNSPYAGFSTVETWLPVTSDYPTRNVKAQQADDTSLLSLYRRLIWQRKQSPALSVGSYEPLDSPPGTFVFLRQYEDETKLVALNFSDRPKSFDIDGVGLVVIDTMLNQIGIEHTGTLRIEADAGVIFDLVRE